MLSVQVTGFDIPHEFPVDYQPVFGMDVWHCVEYYQQRFGRCAHVPGKEWQVASWVVWAGTVDRTQAAL